MRMDRSQKETAADLLQRVDEEELARLLHDWEKSVSPARSHVR